MLMLYICETPDCDTPDCDTPDCDTPDCDPLLTFGILHCNQHATVLLVLYNMKPSLGSLARLSTLS